MPPPLPPLIARFGRPGTASVYKMRLRADPYRSQITFASALEIYNVPQMPPPIAVMPCIVGRELEHGWRKPVTAGQVRARTGSASGMGIIQPGMGII